MIAYFFAAIFMTIVWMAIIYLNERFNLLSCDRFTTIGKKYFAYAWLGLFLFSFLTVFREGVETVAFLGILNFTSAGIGTLVGGLTGIGLAALFAVFFIRGSLRIDLARFFRVTTIILFVFVAQLLINGIRCWSGCASWRSFPPILTSFFASVYRQFMPSTTRVCWKPCAQKWIGSKG